MLVFGGHSARATDRGARSLAVLAAAALAALTLIITLTRPAHAMKIQEVQSPGGIKAWLVEEHSVPLLALRFAFTGGNAQDPAGKEGLANFLTAMMDEGAGDLTATQFQERMEEIAMRMGFEDGRDHLYGSVETLTVNRDKAIALLKLALAKPRFDTDAVERIRKQLLASLAYAERDPDKVAGKEWSKLAFPSHAYGKPANGTPESLKSITREDLLAYWKRVFARSALKVVVVGDIDAKALGTMLDQVFGDLPATSGATPVANVMPQSGAQQRVVEMDVPQSVAVFGHGGIMRKDPDFIPAFVTNHILGGGSFASRLMEEVREKRGLAYSVYSYLQTHTHAAVFAGGVATKNDSIAQSLEVIRAELKRMAEQGPTPTELDNAKKFLIGSYPLRFDTNSKIASQLLGILVEELGLDYVDKRNGLIEAVTVEEAKRVAKRLLATDDLIVVIVGKPTKLPGRS